MNGLQQDEAWARPTADTLRDLVDIERGRISPRIFWDDAIYRLELERIFARCWIFVCHESQVAKPGDFLTTTIGEDGVIVSRGNDGAIRVFLNACPHRGNRVCFAEAGNTRRFTCNYHGWAFNREGGFLGMPEEEIYEKTSPGYDRSELGLVQARVASYKGLTFATFDHNAPSLDDYLGDYRWYLDVLLDNDEGGTEFLEGNIKSVIDCNWKIPAENFIGDSLHAQWTHNSGAVAMLGKGVGKPKQDHVYHANMNGHGWQVGFDMVGNAMTLGEPEIVDYIRERESIVAERLGKLRSRMVGSMASATAFPNFSFLPGLNTIRTWNPRGAHRTELHTWVLVNKNAPQSIKDQYRRGVMRTFSPSGTLEMDDGENWENATSTAAGVITRRQKLHYGLGLNSKVEHDELPGSLHLRKANDSNQRAFYSRWLDLVTAEDWASVPGSAQR
jgi:ethylbenzene dioxygenase alpha subunit